MLYSRTVVGRACSSNADWRCHSSLVSKYTIVTVLSLDNIVSYESVGDMDGVVHSHVVGKWTLGASTARLPDAETPENRLWLRYNDSSHEPNDQTDAIESQEEG